MPIAVDEGFNEQFSALDQYGLDANAWMLGMTADTFPYSTTTTFGDISIAMIGGNPASIDWPGWVTINLGDGQATASVGNGEFSLTANSTSVTLTQWVIYSSVTNVLIWTGDLSPTLTPSPHFPTDVILEGITVTLGSCSPPSSAYGPLLYVSMSADDSTPLTSYTPEVGPVGTAYGGDWIILSNAATDQDLADDDQFVWDVRASDCLFSCEIYLLPDSTGGSYPNICLRQTDKSHLWIIGFGYSGSSLEWSFFVNEGAGYSEIASGSVTISADQWLLITVLMVGPNIVVCAGPDVIISYTSATFNLTATAHGLRNAYPGSGTARSQWRYVTVQPLSYVP